MKPKVEQLIEDLESKKNLPFLFKKTFSTKEGERVLESLENHFSVSLPCFQGGAGSYDPLDAMRRDAHREVFLYIRYMINLSNNQTDNNHNDDDI